MKEAQCADQKMKVNLEKFGRDSGEPKKVNEGHQRHGTNVMVIAGIFFIDVLSNKEIKEDVGSVSLSTMEVYPRDDTLEHLSKSYVGYLHYPRETNMVKISLFMNGWKGIKVAAIGKCMVLFTSDNVRMIEEVRA